MSSLPIDQGLGDQVSALVAGVSSITDLCDVQRLLHDGAAALGAECSCFTTFVVDSAEASYRFVIDCDPGWWHRYGAAGSLRSDPWLAYARNHSEPARAADLSAFTPEQQRTIDLAVDAGFVSALLIPVHARDGRVSLLTLGHSDPLHFQGHDCAVVRVLARAFALELHDWWGGHQRRALLRRTQISAADVRLLERHCAGQSSKQIARELQISPAAVNSRFQRLTARLGARNRRAAAQVAIECGLIVK